MLPKGRRSDAFCAPLKIWSNTGTDGGSNETPLTVKFPLFWCLNDGKGASIAEEAFTHKPKY